MSDYTKGGVTIYRSPNDGYDYVRKGDHNKVYGKLTSEITHLQAELDAASKSAMQEMRDLRAENAALRQQLIDVDYTPSISEVRRENEELRERLTKVVRCVSELIGNSEGVYGLHLNGDPAPWDSLLQGGRDEAWMIDFSEVACAPTGATEQGETE